MDSEKLSALCVSLEKYDLGVLFPLAVTSRMLVSNGGYFVLDGFHRLKAREFLGLPIYFVDLEIDDVVRLENFFLRKTSFSHYDAVSRVLDAALIYPEVAKIVDLSIALNVKLKKMAHWGSVFFKYDLRNVNLALFRYNDDYEAFIRRCAWLSGELEPFRKHVTELRYDMCVARLVRLEMFHEVFRLPDLLEAAANRTKIKNVDVRFDLFSYMNDLYNERLVEAGKPEMDLNSFFSRRAKLQEKRSKSRA
jgi:hypothetical protein